LPLLQGGGGPDRYPRFPRGARRGRKSSVDWPFGEKCQGPGNATNGLTLFGTGLEWHLRALGRRQGTTSLGSSSSVLHPQGRVAFSPKSRMERWCECG